jgi:hypothetical protein
MARRRFRRWCGWSTTSPRLLGQIESDTREDVSAWERAFGYVDRRERITRERGAAPQALSGRLPRANY